MPIVSHRSPARLVINELDCFNTHSESNCTVLHMFLGLNKTLTCWSVKMVKLSSVDRARAIGHLEAGLKQRDVAVHFGVSHEYHIQTAAPMQGYT